LGAAEADDAYGGTSGGGACLGGGGRHFCSLYGRRSSRQIGEDGIVSPLVIPIAEFSSQLGVPGRDI
jgi:hypothetical protein